MRLYLAGPLGFSEAGRRFKDEHLVPRLAAAGHEVVDPWTLAGSDEIAAVESLPRGERRATAWRALNVEIGRRNLEAVRSADALVAVLDGVDVDSGTAAEIGYAFALQKPIVGYRGDFRLCADNEGATVNLQVEFCIRESGGSIVSRIDELAAAVAALTP